MPTQYQTLSVAEGEMSQPQIVVVDTEATVPGQDQQNFLQTTVWQSLRRYMRYSLPAGLLLSFLLFGLGTLLTVPKYRAVSFLRVTAEQKPLVFQTADHPGMKSTFDLYKNTQTQLITTPFVLNAALGSSEVQDLPLIENQADPTAWMWENVDAGFTTDGEIMEVGFTSSDPRSSVVMVNAIVNAYLEEVVNSERLLRFQRLDNLESVRSTSEEQLRSKQKELRFLAAALGTSDSESLTVAQQSAIEQFGLMQEKLSEVQFELMTAQGELDIARELQDFEETQASVTDNSSEEDVSQKPQVTPATLPLHRELMSLRLEIVDTDLQLRDVTKYYGDAHPDVAYRRTALEAKRAGLEQEIESLSAHLEAFEDAGLQNGIGRQSDKMRLAFLEKRVKVLKSQEEAINERVDQLEEGTKELGRSSIDILIMRSEIESLDEVLRHLSEEIERTKIELKTDSRITLVSEAERALAPSQKKRYFTLAFLGFAGLIAPVALGVGWDFSRRRIDSPNMLDVSLTSTHLGSIPQVPVKHLINDAFPITGEVVDSSELSLASRSLSEAIRSTSTLVSKLFHQDNKRVIMLASAIESEGKSTVSIQLAKALAQSKLRVLLLDLDLRRPSLEEYLGLEHSLGASDVLSGNCNWRDAVQKIGIFNVLTAGPADDSIMGYESSGALAELFYELKQEFDLILVDSSPILAVVDACIIGTYCDGVIMTVRRDISRVPLFRNACTSLKRYGVDVLGTVFIGVHDQIGYAYRHYGRKKGSDEKKPLPR